MARRMLVNSWFILFICQRHLSLSTIPPTQDPVCFQEGHHVSREPFRRNGCNSHILWPPTQLRSFQIVKAKTANLGKEEQSHMAESAICNSCTNRSSDLYTLQKKPYGPQAWQQFVKQETFQSYLTGEEYLI